MVELWRIPMRNEHIARRPWTGKNGKEELTGEKWRSQRVGTSLQGIKRISISECLLTSQILPGASSEWTPPTTRNMSGRILTFNGTACSLSRFRKLWAGLMANLLCWRFYMARPGYPSSLSHDMSCFSYCCAGECPTRTKAERFMLNNSGPSASPQDKRVSGSWIWRKASRGCFELSLVVTSCIRTRCKTTSKRINLWHQNDCTGFPWSDSETVSIANCDIYIVKAEPPLWIAPVLCMEHPCDTILPSQVASRVKRNWGPSAHLLRRPERHSSALQANSRRLCLGCMSLLEVISIHSMRPQNLLQT